MVDNSERLDLFSVTLGLVRVRFEFGTADSLLQGVKKVGYSLNIAAVTYV